MIRKGRKIVLSVAQVMIPPGTLESPIFSSIDLYGSTSGRYCRQVIFICEVQ